MSREIIYQDQRLTVATGEDIILGKFFQVFDKRMQNETPEGEGLVYDWSTMSGETTNFTGVPPANHTPEDVIAEYILICNAAEETED